VLPYELNYSSSFRLRTALWSSRLLFIGVWKHPAALNLHNGLILWFYCAVLLLFAPTSHHCANGWRKDGGKKDERDRSSRAPLCFRRRRIKFRVYLVLFCPRMVGGSHGGREPSTEADLVSPPSSSCLCRLRLQRWLSLLLFMSKKDLPYFISNSNFNGREKNGKKPFDFIVHF